MICYEYIYIRNVKVIILNKYVAIHNASRNAYKHFKSYVETQSHSGIEFSDVGVTIFQ